MKLWLLTYSLIMGIFSVNAQVESTAYSIMLKGLLSHSVPEVNVSKAESLKLNGAVFIDARELAEFNISAIENACWVGYDSLNLDPISNIKKDTPLVVYCSVGYRSEKVAEKLIEQGFSEVYNLYGGLFEWVNQGKPVYKAGEQTKQVHGFSKVWGIWLNKGEKIYK
jgi:rhodanese-related sulfurtransferase